MYDSCLIDYLEGFI